MQNNELAALRERVRVLEQEREIQSLLYRYAHAVDFGVPEDMPKLFTEDGAFEFQSGARNRFAPDEDFPVPEDYLLGLGASRTEKGFRFSGRKELLQFISGANFKWLRLHAVLQPAIRLVDDREARVESHLIAVGKLVGGPRTVEAFGRYFDHIVREADGHWRFRERVIEL